MTESDTKYIDSELVENAVLVDINIGSNDCANSRLEVVNVAAGNCSKNEIKVSAEGVARLSFGFLEDMQGGDSSLEPGEVKTPPPGSSPLTIKESTPSRLAQEKPAKEMAKETLSKVLKTVSQLEAEACEEKVRAILELDAKRRKEEVERRKLEAEKRRQTGETDLELENRRKAKEERRKLKKLKKAKKAAEEALICLEEDDVELMKRKKRKIRGPTESEESEGLCSSGPDDEEDKPIKSEKHCSALNSAIAVPSVPTLRYPAHLPPHLLPDAFMGGFRPINPFLRGLRPDFSHGRGNFLLRGRGGMRGRMPFPVFRPPFFPGSGAGCGQLKFNVPHGIQQQRQHHTPPPNRGHSPILPPGSDLMWTKCKPSLSYSLKSNKETKFQVEKQNSQATLQPEDKWDSDNFNVFEKQTAEDKQRTQHEHKKGKRRKSLQKEKKKSKRHREKDSNKSKKNKISLQSSSSLIKHKKKAKKSSRKKIEKIRKSYGSSARTTPTLQEQRHSLERTETTESLDKGKQERQKDEEMPDEEEIRQKVENIKQEKLETTQLKIQDLALKVKPFVIIKTEPQEESEEIAEKVEKAEKVDNQEKCEIDASKNGKNCDSFAQSSNQTKVTSECKVNQAKHTADNDSKENEVVSVTPPLPPINNPQLQKSASLQNALEIQKRIDKLLQQDDIKLEAIEAAKNLLIKKTQKHQNSKERLTPERESTKSVGQKPTGVEKLTAESSSSKEKPKAYKDKESNKKSKNGDKEKGKEKDRYSSKNIEDTEYKHYERNSSLHSKEKTKDSHKDCKSSKNMEVDKQKARKSENDNEKEKDKSRKGITNPNYRNPFKRSLSRDRFFGKIDSRRRSKTRSRERDFSSKRLSLDRKRGDSSGYSSSRISSKRRVSGCSSASSLLNRSKSGERDIKGSLDSLNSKEQERKNRKRDKTPEVSRSKSKRSLTPKRSKEKTKESKEFSTNSKKHEKNHENNYKSTTPPPKSTRNSENLQEKQVGKEIKKSKSPIKTAPKKRPLSFTQTEFLFPEDGNEDDFILGDDEETNDSFKDLKSNSDKEDSPDTDDYMDNWENDEDVDIDTNSNMPTDIFTPRKSLTDLTEEDSFVTRFVNPSPPKEILEKQSKTNTNVSGVLDNNTALPLTPPLDLLKNLPKTAEPKEISLNNLTSKPNSDTKKPELFGMQELYDQFIKSVEASGVSMKTAKKEDAQTSSDVAGNSTTITDGTQNEEPLSTSSASTSSSTSSSSSSSSDSNSSSNSSSSSSSESSSDDSNDGVEFTKTTEQPTKKVKLEKSPSPKNSSTEKQDDSRNTAEKPSIEIVKREPRTPSPTPLQSNLPKQTPPTPAPQNKAAPKTDVAKDFKKLKNLEANLSRIQMMRANYDSNDEISEELHKMEMLFLQEKKIILQKYAKNTQAAEKTAATNSTVTTSTATTSTGTGFVPALPKTDLGSQKPPLPPPEEPNKIFDANREAIKLTISPLKLPTKPAIFNISLNEESEKKVSDDKDEFDFTEKLVKPAKEVAIVKPIMESKESKESRTRESHRHRRSPIYGSSRDRQRSPNNYRDRNRRSSSRNRFSPQRRGRGRSLSLSPPRRGTGMRHGSPPRRGAPSSRFRASGRRSRSRSRSPLRQFGNRRGKEGSPFRRKRGTQHDLPSHYKKFGRQRGSRSRSPRSPQTRPRSPRTPPPRRRSYSQDPFSRSPLPFKPPSPPMRRSMSPTGSPSSNASRSRSPPSSHRPRSPRSPRSPISPRSLSPRSPDSPSSHRYDDHRYRRENSFERHSSISPHPQYFTPESLSASASSQSSPYYYNVSPNRISLDARINIVLNTPASGGDTPPAGYESYGSYAQYGGAAYMSIPPQPMAGAANNMSYYPNPYVPMMSSTHDGHHSIIQPHAHDMQHSLHPPQPHQPQQQHPSVYSSIPTINSGTPNSSSPLPLNNFYYNDFNLSHQPINPVLKEIPKAPVAVQKGNVLEIVPFNPESSQSPQIDNKTKTSPVLIETIKNHIDKIASISWKDEVNNRHVKSAVMRLNRGGENSTRSILKRSEVAENSDKIEKKKVYFEDGIYPSRDSEDEDRKIVEYKIRKKVLRLRKKRGIDVPAAREIIDSKIRLQKPKIDAALEKLPPPPPPATMPPPNLEQPNYLRPPTPVPLVYFHFDSFVHSMYVSQLEKPIPPRLLNPKCVPAGATTAPSSSGNTVGANASNAAPNQSPNLSIPSGGSASKKELTTLAALNRVGRNENVTSSPKSQVDIKQESPNSQQSPQMPVIKPSGVHFTPPPTSPQMSPLHGPAIRHPQSPIGFVGMRINNFMRLPPSPLTRTAVPPHMQAPPPNMVNLPPGMVGIRHPHYNMPPPNLMPPNMPSDANYNSVGGGAPYGTIPAPPPGFQSYGQRPMNPGFFMGPASPRTMHPPPPMPANPHAKGKDILYHTQHHHHHHPPHPHQHSHQHHQQYHHNQHKPPPPLPSPMVTNVAAPSPQAMIAPYNVKKTVN